MRKRRDEMEVEAQRLTKERKLNDRGGQHVVSPHVYPAFFVILMNFDKVLLQKSDFVWTLNNFEQLRIYLSVTELIINIPIKSKLRSN